MFKSLGKWGVRDSLFSGPVFVGDGCPSPLPHCFVLHSPLRSQVPIPDSWVHWKKCPADYGYRTGASLGSDASALISQLSDPSPSSPKKESDRIPWDHQDGSRFLSLGKNFLSSSVKFPACRNCVKQLASVIKQLLLVSITEKKMKLPSPKRPDHPNPEMLEEINIKIHV